MKENFKRTVKGYLIWIWNNAFFVGIPMAAKDHNIISVIVLVLLWFFTGHLIVEAFRVLKIEHIYSAPAGIAKEIPWKEEKTNEK